MALSTPLLPTSGAKVNPLYTELNPVCYLLALLGAHHILHVSRVQVKEGLQLYLHPSPCAFMARYWKKVILISTVLYGWL